MEKIVTPRSVFMPLFSARDRLMVAMLLRNMSAMYTPKKFSLKVKSYAQAQGQPAEFATLF